MTHDEAVEILAEEGLGVVGNKIHPRDWPLLEWGEILFEAVERNRGLMDQIKVWHREHPTEIARIKAWLNAENN